MLYGIVSLPRIGQVYVMYRGAVAYGGYGVGDESTEVRLFPLEEIPWSELAFPVVELTLRRYLADRRAGRFRTFDVTLSIRPGEPLPHDVVSS